MCACTVSFSVHTLRRTQEYILIYVYTDVYNIIKTGKLKKKKDKIVFSTDDIFKLYRIYVLYIYVYKYTSTPVRRILNCTFSLDSFFISFDVYERRVEVRPTIVALLFIYAYLLPIIYARVYWDFFSDVWFLS